MNARAMAARQLRSGAAALTQRVSSAGEPLAVPPPGSGLEAVLGDFGPPVIGRTLEFVDDVLELSKSNFERFGPVSWIGGFGTKTVLALGPDAIGAVLANRDKAFANEPGWSYFIGPFFNRGIMLMDFEEHLQHRRIMQQAFTRERLTGYLDAMNPAIARGIERWRPDPQFPLQTNVKRLTLDIATEVFLGAELGPEAERVNRAFEDTVVAGASLVRADVPGGRWRRGLRGRRVLE
jgi:cytochrome P450